MSDINKELEDFLKEQKVDHQRLEADKKKFINQIKGELGRQMNSFDTYVKKEPTALQKFTAKIKRLFKYL